MSHNHTNETGQGRRSGGGGGGLRLNPPALDAAFFWSFWHEQNLMDVFAKISNVCGIIIVIDKFCIVFVCLILLL